MPKHANMVARFWEKVAVGAPDDCWEWLGAVKSGNGYGVLSIAANNRVQVYAHRVSAAIHFGMFGRRDLVCHHCDNRRCVNPAHLYLGNERTNAADMMQRGRGNGQFTKQSHCARGHEFTPENTYTYGEGKRRQCYACKRANSQKRLVP